MEIIAHRGASHEAPENTLAAVHQAWQQQADAVEVDVRLSRDGHPVVIHDETTQRTAGIDQAVGDQTLARLQSLDAGAWKGPRWRGEPIPALHQVLTALPPGKRLFLEIKAGPESIPPLKTALHQAGRQPGQIAMIAFDLSILKQIKAALPGHPVFWVCRFQRSWYRRHWTPAISELVPVAVNAGFDGLNLKLQGPVDTDSTRRVKAAGLQLYIWTVDSPKAARRLAKAGVDGITTNRPGWMRQKLASLIQPDRT